MNLTKTSKYLSLILRHHPEAAGITLDEHGWADVEDLIGPEDAEVPYGDAGGNRPDRQQTAVFL